LHCFRHTEHPDEEILIKAESGVDEVSGDAVLGPLVTDVSKDLIASIFRAKQACLLAQLYP
jgi:hypothetical protein